MTADIMMEIDGKEWRYGTYAFDTDEQKNRVNGIAAKVKEERGVPVYVRGSGRNG